MVLLLHRPISRAEWSNTGYVIYIIILIFASYILSLYIYIYKEKEKEIGGVSTLLYRFILYAPQYF